MDLPTLRNALRDEGLDAWLLYDFRDLNPLSVRVAGRGDGHRTRRWFCLVRREGPPCWIVHRIERRVFADVTGEILPYATQDELEARLGEVLEGTGTVAMETAPGGDNPYVSRVDAGTVDLVRDRGVEVVSSGDLVQRALGRWSDRGLRTHREAVSICSEAIQRAFRTVALAVDRGRPTTERAVQEMIEGHLADGGLIWEGAPIVAVDEHAGDPHYVPDAEGIDRAIPEGAWLLLDVWGKKAGIEDACYADMTWVGHVGDEVPAGRRELFGVVRDARDAALDLVRERFEEERTVEGHEVDRAARAVIEEAGHGDAFCHRTGHSLGPELHSVGAHLDGYETVDRRRLLPGTGFTVEPGIYLDEIGCRSEVDVWVGPDGPEVTTPLQEEVVTVMELV